MDVDEVRLVSPGSSGVMGVMEVNIVAFVVINVHDLMFMVGMRDFLGRGGACASAVWALLRSHGV